MPKQKMKQQVRWVFDTGDFGSALRQLRQARGLNQAELAARIGVTRMTVSRLEQGDAVSVDTALRALAECGYAAAVAPKFARLEIIETPQTSDG